MQYKEHFFSPNTDSFVFFSQLLEPLKLSKFRTLEQFLKLFPDINLNTEIPDMSRKFRTYGNPSFVYHPYARKFVLLNWLINFWLLISGKFIGC